MPVPMLRISIEGNIATGKSTFVKILKKQNDPNWTLFSEPVEKWTNLSDNDDEVTASQQRGGNLLQMFYSDTARWCSTFQSYSLLSRMRMMQDIPAEKFNTEDPVSFFERSLLTDRFVFAQNCYDSGLMSELELSIYHDCHNHILKTVSDVKLDGIIYLKADPELCMKRMLKRARKEESGVTLEYLQALYRKHEDWLHNPDCREGYSTDGTPIIEIDCSQEFASDEDLKASMLKRVQDFVKHLRAQNKENCTSTAPVDDDEPSQ